MTLNIRPVGPDVPPALQPIMTELREAVMALQTPAGPQPMFACLQASLPPAESYTYHTAMVTDLAIPVISDGTDWLRFDDGTAI